ncbi:transposase [Escherichia coli]|uniref:phage terminase large subunit family protein n=1 Tax=Escherichia coli TaxID=562 RepID=UPI0020237A2A|nr:transposase [Escherichia coli]MCL8442903.1 transposase [Escherichia coli]
MIDVLGPEKRRRRTTQEKIAIVQQSFEPGMTVSLVARQHGVAASQLFLWRKQYQEGSLTAVAAGEQVVPASELAAAMKQIKELQRLLGKKTMENELLKEAVEYGRAKKLDSARALIARGWGVSLVSRCLRVSRAQLHVILRRTDDWMDGRRSRHTDDTDVLLRIHHVIGELPTYGYRRVPEETIKCQPFECPDHFYVIGGMDFGWDHPQAQVQLWWDKDADIIYVSRVWKAKEKTAVQAWGAVKSWAHKVPTAWPHDGNQHEKGGGEQLKGQYADAGFMMLQEHATWPDGGNAVEPGITELRDMMLDGRFKVFNTCEPFFEEFRLYHRDENGKIVKLNDDVLSAVRYAYMMRRFAKMMRDIKKPKEKKIPAPIRPIARRT